MPNFRNWTASEIVAQMPQARNVLAKHFGPEGITTASGASLRDLAKRKGVDLSTVIADLNAMAKDSAIFAPT
jgi:iron-sulfur cluster repair protein YtfE (RIC family)